MNHVQRALIVKELGRAQLAVWGAFRIAAAADQLDLAAELRRQHKALGATITETCGGPVKVQMKELMR